MAAATSLARAPPPIRFVRRDPRPGRRRPAARSRRGKPSRRGATLARLREPAQLDLWPELGRRSKPLGMLGLTGGEWVLVAILVGVILVASQVGRAGELIGAKLSRSKRPGS